MMTQDGTRRARARPRRRPRSKARSSRRRSASRDRPATDDEIRAGFGASGGSLGPVGFTGEIVADEALRQGQFVAGANRDGWHLLGVEAGRDYEPRFADLRESAATDRCPSCGGPLRFETAIEVGHIFKLGTRYSAPLGATFLDEDGREKPLVMGSYGIGPGTHHGGGGRAAPRRARNRLAGRDRALRRPRGRAPRRRGDRTPGGRGALGGRPRRAARRPRAARRREVRRCRPDRLPAADHGGQEEPRGRQGRRPRACNRRREAIRCCRAGQGSL